MNWSYSCVLLLSTTILLCGCSGNEDIPEEVVRPVRTIQVQLTQSNVALDLAGEVQARYTSSLGFQVPGKLIKRLVEVGEQVKKGQLLATIDDRDYRLQLQQANAKLNVAKANQQRAQTELDRFDQLLSQKLISPSQHESQLNSTRVAQAQVQEAQSAVNIADNRMQYTELHADSAGVVTQIFGEVGQVLAAGQRIIEVARPKFKEVWVELPESLIQGITVGDEVLIAVWALQDKTFKGVVRELAPQADSVTRTYLSKVTVEDDSSEIELGMSARVNFAKNTGNDVAKVPPSSIVIFDDKPHVWVVNEAEGIVNKREIKISEQLADQVIVFEGVITGERLVTAGVHRLHEGQTVRLLKE